MKIAILTEIVSRKSGARAPLEIAKALRAQEDEVTLFAYSFGLEKEALKELKKAKVDVEIITSGKLRAPLKIANLLKKGGFEIVSFHGTLPFFLGAKLSGLPIVRTYYGTQLDALLDKVFPNQPNLFLRLVNRLTNKIMILQEKLFLSLSDRVLAISKYTQDELKKLYGVSSETVYLGVSPAFFKPIPPRGKKTITILSVSRIVPYKGFHKLILIFNRLNQKFPHLKLTIIGSSPDRSYLAYLKKRANENVNFLIDASDKELIRAYQKADIYATFDRYMFFGMPILEAASFGTPTVAIARCAAKETVKHGQTGYLAENEIKFENHLEQLIKNSTLRKTLGKAAQNEARFFSWENLAKKYQLIFRKIKRESRFNSALILTGILALGILLRLAFLTKHAFWFDEAFSYFVARQPFSSLIVAASADNQPLFYYLLLKIWSSISREIWFLRLLSLIFGVLSIPLFYQIGKKLASFRVALLATIIFALSPLHIYFSVETRMYTLLVFEVLFLSWSFLKFLETKRKIYLALLTLFAVFALYTHPYSALIFLTLNLIFLTQIRNMKGLFSPWLTSQFIIFLALLSWLFLIFKYPRPDCWCFPPQIGLPATFASFAAGGMGVVTLKDFVLAGPRLSLIFFSLLSILMFSAFLVGLWSLRKRGEQGQILFLFFWAPIFVATLIALFYPLFSPRALIIVSPFYYLLVALGIPRLQNRLVKDLLVKTLFILILATLGFQFLNPFFSGPPLKEAASLVAKNHEDGEAILHLSPITFYSFQYFHHFSYPEFLTPPPNIPPPAIFALGNYQKSVEEITQNYSKIWFVNTRNWTNPSEAKRIKQSLSLNFTPDQETNYNNIELFHYTRQKP